MDYRLQLPEQMREYLWALRAGLFIRLDDDPPVRPAGGVQGARVKKGAW